MPERISACRYGPRGLVAASLVAAAAWSLPVPALALSEIQREDLSAPVPSGEAAHAAPDAPAEETPETAPIEPEAPDLPAPEPQLVPDEDIPTEATPRDESEEENSAGSHAGPPPEVLHDLALLPEPVRRMRELIVQACRSGDIEALRPLIETGEDGTQLSVGSEVGDPIEFLREASGDDQGHEILAIMLEVLNAGYVRLDARSPNELYVWPYFFAVPLEGLEPRQRVELFKLVTAGDYEDMKAFGAYNFYRLGITPEGRWAFFVAGD